VKGHWLLNAAKLRPVIENPIESIYYAPAVPLHHKIVKFLVLLSTSSYRRCDTAETGRTCVAVG
jgi:hypothetical protein